MARWTHFALAVLATQVLAAENRTFNVFDFVDPLIGTSNGGHVFPGASLPFGMAKAVADVSGDNQGGFASDSSSITGFSHMHDSGTGGSPSLGNFPIFPSPPCPGNDLDKCKWTKKDRPVPRVDGSVVASPGYFAVGLSSGINAEVTVANHTALYRLKFPSGNAGNIILMDATDIPNSRQKATLHVDPQSGRMTGNGTFGPSFGIGTYTLYVCADFQGAKVKDAGVWVNKRAGTETQVLHVEADGINNNPPLPAGVFVRFDEGAKEVSVRVGVSLMDIDQACYNAESEIPKFDFENTKEAAEDVWKKKLGVVEIKTGGVNETMQKVFWSGLYRTMLSPQDYTGENPLWKSDEPYYDSYYCIWDSFRSVHPLITLVDPVSQSLMVRSLLDIYKHEGKLPDCRMSLCKGFTQGGSNADVVIAETFLKGIQNGIDWDLAYEAVVSDAEDEPLNWSVEGRGGLKSWKELGYIPTDDYDPYGVGPTTRSISRTVEYAYNDFCIALMAQKMNRHADFEKYVKRSGNWRNMFNPDQKSLLKGADTGFKGFLQPRFQNGTWGFQDPIFCSPLLNFSSCYLNPQGHETYEGSSWMYTFYVPQDHASLIVALGGPDAFVRRLDYLHHSGLLYIGDEQAFFPVFQYHYAGRPGKSTDTAHLYIPRDFNDQIGGIPGNDDSGAMGSFAVLSMMGLFPVPGQSVYLINSPFFEEVAVTNGLTGAKAVIRNVGFDPAYKNRYIQSAKLNGRIYTKNWISHDFFAKGGVLELVLGEKEGSWGTRKQDLPPSMGPE